MEALNILVNDCKYWSNKMFTIQTDKLVIVISDGKNIVTIAYNPELTLQDLLKIFEDTMKYVEE
jgi:hypothetical protein